MASAVELLPVPAITGTRPATTSITRLMTPRCSSVVSVADSPVVPMGTMPFVPLSRCHSTSRSKAAQSSAPEGVMGVTKATMLPLNMGCVLAVMAANVTAKR